MRALTALMATTSLLVTVAASCGGTAIVDPPDDDGAGGSATGTGSGTASGTTSGTGTGSGTSVGRSTGTSAGTPGAIGTGTGTPGGTATGTPTGTPNPCLQQPDFESCANCLAMMNPQGVEDYTFALYDNCVCGPDCAMICQSECMSPEPFQNPLSPPCDSCFQDAAQDQNGACIVGFQNQCGASPACVQFITDLQNCP